MLTIQDIKNRKDEMIAALKKRNFDASALLDKALELDEKRKTTQQELDQALSEVNRLSKEIGNLFKEGKKDEAEAIKADVEKFKSSSNDHREAMTAFEKEIFEILVQVPNIPNDLVVEGKSEEDNVEVFSSITDIPGDLPKPHWELAKDHDIIDMELGNKVTGSGFPIYKGKGAKLQRSLVSYFLDRATEAGYTEYIPPLLVNEDSAHGTGQLPDKEGQMYHVTEDDLYLIPTAEVPITNIYRDSIVEENDLPIKMVGFTPCFRREAGSYGKEVRGLNRVHQFEKVEIVQIAKPENSYEILDQMVEHVKSLLNDLELPFRVVRLCGGDLGFTSAMTYDFEVYSRGQQRWLEVSSVSNFETFQANRLKLRYRTGDKKKQLAHTLNGSALALARIVAALLENNQTEDGIVIPEKLRAYTGFDKII